MRKKSLGFGFQDEVIKNNPRRGHFRKTGDQDWQDLLIPNYDPHIRVSLENSFWRTYLLLSLSILLFFILFVRLFHLQIVRGQYNRELADGNRILVKVIHAPRGVIFDRNGKILAENSPGFRLVEGSKSTFLSREEALNLEVRNDPRVQSLEVDTIRTYPLKEVSAHVLGFVGGDRIGQAGIEAQYEDLLKGVDGGEIIEVDAEGKKLRTLRVVAPIPGKNLYLTIDSDLQKITYDKLKETTIKSGSCCGVAIALDPNTGQILSLVSLPSYDNNVFTSQDTDLINEVLKDPDSAILNRATSGTYPPGSTFKIISSLAALASGKITPQTQIEDTGQIFLGTFRFTNWYFTQYGRTEGSVDLVKALKRSNDTYFYRVGQTIGEQAIFTWASKLRLGDKTDIDLPGEVRGLIPSNGWKVKNTGQPWYPGDTLHLSIGQGFLLTTPIQVLGMASFIAGSGNLYKPQLFLKATDGSETIKSFESKLLVSNIISKDHLDVIKEGLRQAVSYGGTAWPLFTFPISTGGKTGTAEFGSAKNYTHAWYTGFAPFDDPKIAAVALIEAGGEGSSVASPVVKEIFRWYLSEDKNNLIKDTDNVATDSARTLGE